MQGTLTVNPYKQEPALEFGDYVKINWTSLGERLYVVTRMQDRYNLIDMVSGERAVSDCQTPEELHMELQSVLIGTKSFEIYKKDKHKLHLTLEGVK
ncbi:hypothetical protein [Bacillus paramobilis]|uniref:hypothetical protein n=1 Tax=Bacillus paramobilis TaxID=2817477 RepID=UPI001BB31300|nr:hypothetical protein [Bacillus paramobilis]HEF5065778.1 hypothetical protein [Bacillus cereus]HEF5237762.1 hypothetical protein [Bacillus cereus]